MEKSIPIGRSACRLRAAVESLPVKDRQLLKSRMCWYDNLGARFDPPFAQVLEDDEIALIAQWFQDTNDAPFVGEAGFVCASFLATLILSNCMKNVVQFGHYAGFSSLVIGLLLRKISPDARLISFDIDHKMTTYCNLWTQKAGLDDHVLHLCVDSTDPITIDLAGAHLTGNPELIFIDASKQYHNTIAEVEWWSRFTDGFIVAHDVSALARGQQANGALGVSDGLTASKAFAPNELLLIDPEAERRAGFPYWDPAGLGVGVSRATQKLPLHGGGIGELIKKRQVVEDRKLRHAENWFLDQGFSATQGRLIKAEGFEAFAGCYAPIEDRQTLRCEINVRESNGGGIGVCGGGNPGSLCMFYGDGTFTGEFTVGDENSLVAIYGPKESRFAVDHISVVPAA